MTTKPDYEVSLHYVTFYGATATAALEKLLSWLKENENQTLQTVADFRIVVSYDASILECAPDEELKDKVWAASTSGTFTALMEV